MNDQQSENQEIEVWDIKQEILNDLDGRDSYIFDKKARIISFKNKEIIIGIAPGYSIPRLEEIIYGYLRHATGKREDDYKIKIISDPLADTFKVEIEDKLKAVHESILSLKEFIEKDENNKASNDCRTWGQETEIYEWENLRFRVPHEIKIAQALDKKNILFWANSACRFGTSERKNIEPDFLVCYEGKWGILEIDSSSTHKYLTQDAGRDRVLKLHGIKVIERYDWQFCDNNPDTVVTQFIKILQHS